jgi:GWxTD domain-containing protein
VDEDVVYIITKDERDAFRKLLTDAEREEFIEQFWERRDPTPDTVENEFKEEHYRRIAYANEHFAESVPGWKTDRGRIYIMYGLPDEIDARRAGPTPADTYPIQQWRYRWIEGVGNNVIIEFDANGSGDFHMTMDPSEKDRLLHEQDAGPGRAEVAGPQPSQMLASLDKQIRHAEDTLASVRQEFTESFPAVRKLEAEIEQLKATRAEVVSRLEH